MSCKPIIYKIKKRVKWSDFTRLLPVFYNLQKNSTALSYSRYYYYSLIFTIFLAAFSIVMNRWLIPQLDINGAALASTLSYALYFVLLLAFVRWRVGVLPLSKQLLPVIAITMVLFTANWLWTNTLTSWFGQLFAQRMLGLCLDAGLKSTLFVCIGVLALYHLRVSPAVNGLVDKAISIVVGRR